MNDSTKVGVMILLGVFVLVSIAIYIQFQIRKKLMETKIIKAEEDAKRTLEDAEKTADAKKKEAILEAKEEVHKLRADVEKELRERRNEIQRLERRTLQKEESLDKKGDVLEKKEEAINKKQQDIQTLEDGVQALYTKQREELERLSGLSSEEARQFLLNEVSKEIKHETAIIIKEAENKAKEDADKKAREIITCAIQRCAADHVSESTVHVVALPNDEMKGRIIGREGRNIRTLETLTGVDLIIDDTPEAVILSSFDPIRREVARIALEKLIIDGRIHPARIEEMVERAKKEVETT